MHSNTYHLVAEQQLQQYSKNGVGHQSVILSGNSFKPGMYLYALVVDGKEVDIKRMIITKERIVLQRDSFHTLKNTGK